MTTITALDLFSAIPERFSPLFTNATAQPWEALNRLDEFIHSTIKPGVHGTLKGDVYLEGEIEIGEGTIVEHGAVIIGPTIIGRNCQVRAGAYVRGFVATGDGCCIGHSTEVIRSILFNDVRADHLSYIGDSILGTAVHLGAGAKVANLRFDKHELTVAGVPTGRQKLGVILGDRCQLGVNVVVGPGVILKPDTWLAGFNLTTNGIYDRDDIRRLLAQYQNAP